MLRTIKLHGKLASDTQVESIKLDVDTPQMALLGLKSAVPDFEESLRSLDCPLNIISCNTKADGSQKVKGYTVSGLRDDLGQADEINIVPDINGAGGEIVAWYLGTTVAELTVAQMMIGVVISLSIASVVSAVAQSFAPKPDTSAGSQPAAQRPSFIFNGPVNVSKQGYAIPLVYGTCLTGSIVISSSEDVVELTA